MTDEVAAARVPDPSASGSPTPAIAPVVAEAAVAPAVAAVAPAVEAAPAAPAAPAIAEAPVAAAPAAEPAAPAAIEAEAKAAEPAAPERPKTLLEKADEERAAKEAAKAKKPDEAAKPGEEAKPAEEAKPLEGEILPLDFKWPENIKVVPEQAEEFGNALRAAKTGDLKEVGQKLVEMHAKAMDAFAKQYAQEVSDNQWKVWNELIATKDKEVLADPVIGGSGHATAMAAIVRMRDLLVPESERASFTEFLNVTGAGSWPPFLRMLHRSAEIFDEPPMPAPGGRPPKDAHIQQPAGRFALLHDHPSSQINGSAR